MPSFSGGSPEQTVKSARRYPLRDVLQLGCEPVSRQIQIIGRCIRAQRWPVLPRNAPALSSFRLRLRPAPNLRPANAANLRDLGGAA